jgi:PadR family transcriptional regulator, regulatory protein PadR
MKRNRPPSAQAQALIIALAIRPSEWRYGYDLMKATDIKSGTLYPALMRLEEKGLMESRWSEPQQDGRPPRHMYRLTDAGLKLAHALDSASIAPALIAMEQPA